MIIRRLLFAIPLLFAVIVVNFVVIHLAPGDPIQALIGDFPAPPAYVEEMRAAFGLDQPLHVQLLLYVGNIVQGDFGYSFYFRRPVLEVVLDRMPATIELVGLALTFSALFGIAIGIVASQVRGSIMDTVLSTAALVGYCVPVFWLGLILMLVFSVQLGWFPSQGARSVTGNLQGFDALGDHLAHLVLPVLALSTRQLAVYMRVMRSSMLEVSREDYVVLGRAKGLDRNQVVGRHMVPNALLPVVTILGLDVASIFTGSILVETVFGWPGAGRLMYEAILHRDYPVLMGNFILVTGAVVVANLFVDIVYGWLDPRVQQPE